MVQSEHTEPPPAVFLSCDASCQFPLRRNHSLKVVSCYWRSWTPTQTSGWNISLSRWFLVCKKHTEFEDVYFLSDISLFFFFFCGVLQANELGMTSAFYKYILTTMVRALHHTLVLSFSSSSALIIRPHGDANTRLLLQRYFALSSPLLSSPFLCPPSIFSIFPFLSSLSHRLSLFMYLIFFLLSGCLQLLSLN